MTAPDVLAALIARRYALGLSQADIAAAMIVPRSTIGAMESGHRPNPTLSTLQRYAAAVGARITLEINT